MGGFKFPWLGLWNSRGVVLPDDVAPADAWAYYYQHQDPMDLLLVAAYTKLKVAADIVPQDLYGLQLRCTAGDAGQLGMGELFDQWRSWLRCTGPHELLPTFLEPRLFPRAPRGRPWPAWGEKAPGRTVHYVDGCNARTQVCSSWARPAQSAETLQGACAGHAASGCVVTASPGVSHAALVEDVRRCLLQVDFMTEGAPLKSPQHLFALRTLAILLGCSAMASGGKGYYAAQAAASSSSGGDPDPGWRAADSLMMIAAQRARQWRENEGLLDDNDFAYAYTNYDQVIGLAGHHVADDWLQTRARVEEHLLAAGAKVVEDNPKGSVTLRPVRKTIYKKKPKAVNVDKNLDEAVQKRVNGLVSMFVGMGAYKPAGILTDTLKAEWKQTCKRIAEKKVKDAEKATIDRVVNTWLELRAFLESRGRPAPPGMVDLDQFLNHTSAPARALQALKWMNKNADQDLELGNLQVPTTPRATGQRGQAPVVEPPLVQALEDRIVELHAVGDERWSVLLAPWIMSFGCLRYAHIARSEPRRLTAAFLHCRCPKGKQKHAREGFDFAVPATFANGFFWAKEVLEAYRTLAPARQRLAGLCFSDEGRPWTILEVQETMQQEMSVFLDNPEDLTTYSWRRLAPTVAQLLGCRPEEMAALGDWQAKSEQPEVGAMAFHYSSAKYAASIKVKSLIWGATAKLTSNLLWEAIPQAELDAARAHGLTEADRLLRQDRQPMWASAHSFQDVKKRLKLSQQFVEAAQQARQEAEAAPAPQLPDQLKGKVLTATLKNGKAICPDFQTDECPNPADSCPFGVHLCAILQKSGRACGGKHGAGICHIKRAVMAATAVPAAPKPSATLVPAAVGEKATFGRKRAAASGATDDEMAEVMRTAVKKARGQAAPKTPPKAPAIAAPKTPPKAKASTPKPPATAAKSMAAATTPKRLAAPGKPQTKALPKKGHGKAAGDTLDLHLERLGVGSGTAQAPTCIWTSRKGGGVYLAGLPMRQTVDKFPKTALQICCFPHGPESRGG